MPVSHYENFPVASLLLPRDLRAPVESIYWFARTADDFADEGEHEPSWRLARLDEYAAALDRISAGDVPEERAWSQLARHVTERRLPLGLFRDLLSAFAQDVERTRYETFEDVADYCRRSANPVGRLMLHLYGAVSEQTFALSDRICTGLQLLNFCQDVAIDWSRGRLYVPLAEMRMFGVTEQSLSAGRMDATWERVFELQLRRALACLRAGSELPKLLRGRPRFELQAIIAGGERIGARLAATRGDVFRCRPRLDRIDWLVIAARTLWPRAGTQAEDPLAGVAS